jgi:hypothetical protein
VTRPSAISERVGISGRAFPRQQAGLRISKCWFAFHSFLSAKTRGNFPLTSFAPRLLLPVIDKSCMLSEEIPTKKPRRPPGHNIRMSAWWRPKSGASALVIAMVLLPDLASFYVPRGKSHSGRYGPHQGNTHTRRKAVIAGGCSGGQDSGAADSPNRLPSSHCFTCCNYCIPEYGSVNLLTGFIRPGCIPELIS